MAKINQKTSTIPVLRNDDGITKALPPHDYIHAATSDNTRKAYQADIRHFTQWGGLLPTVVDIVKDELALLDVPATGPLHEVDA